MTESEKLSAEILTTTAEVVRLTRQKVELAGRIDTSVSAAGRAPRTAVEQAKSALQTANLRQELAELDRKIDIQEERERQARMRLAQLRRSDYVAVEAAERQEYRARPIAATGIHITKADLEKAQGSVPQAAFFACLAAIVLIATFAISSLSLPDWLTIVLYVVSLGVTLALGIPQIYFAKKQLELARLQEVRQTSTDRTSGAAP